MSKETYIARYRAIINALENSNKDIQEIMFSLKTQSEISGYDFNISKRTFERDVNEIRGMFGIDIRYDFTKKKYFIFENNSKNNEALLQSFDVFQALKLSAQIGPFIIPEKRRSSGTQHLNGIMHAIQNGLQLKISYHKFYEEVAEKRVLNPYFAIESQGRWYLLATKDGKTTPTTYSLDRIETLEVSNTRFKAEAKIKPQELFEHSFGIIIADDIKPEKVVLEFTSFQGKYINTYPLHHSQKVTTETKKHIAFELYINITHDFIIELQKYGPEVKVLEPKHLQKTLIDNAKAVIKGY